MNDDQVLDGAREDTDPENDPHNAVAQFITEAEENERLSPEDTAEARTLLGEIGSNTEEAPVEQVERLRQILEEVDASRAAELIDHLLPSDAPEAT